MIDIYDYSKRLERAKRRLSRYENSELILAFISHLEALGLSLGRVAKYANHLCAILGGARFNLAEATRKDVERAVFWINRQPYKSSTKRDLKLTIKKLVQYVKCGGAIGRRPCT